MKSTNYIMILAATCLFFHCGVNGRLDESLSEFHAMNENITVMNKNMADMNKNMKTNLQIANNNFSKMNTDMNTSVAQMNKSTQSIANSMKEFEKMIGMLKYMETISRTTDKFEKLADQMSPLLEKFMKKGSYNAETSSEEYFQ